MPMHSARSLLLPVLGLALLVAGCTAPAQPLGAKVSAPEGPSELPFSAEPGSPAGGGRVLNAPPRVAHFTSSMDFADNGGGSREVFRAVLADDNAEGDLMSIALTAAGPQRLAFSHSITARELEQQVEPAAGADGWGVWDEVPMDGLLQVSVTVTYPYGAAVGTYTWTLLVVDAAGARATSDPDLTEVEPVHVVEVEGAVSWDGAPAEAEGWGGWAAAPGAKGVPSETFLKVVNKGTAGDQAFVVDFSTKHFLGVEDRAWRVPLDGNVRFAAWETSPGKAPEDGVFRYGEVSPDGSVTLRFTQPGTVIYVAYEVVQVPTPLPSQTYYASATVTAL